MKVKKAFQPLIDFLVANSTQTVEAVLDQVVAMCEAGKGGGGARTASTVIRDLEGNVVAVFCYYHKRWELIAEVEFGKKASSATGLNNMCKEGTSAWTKQQNAAKKATNALLNQVVAGDLASEDIPQAQTEIEEARSVVTPREDEHGYDDKAEVHEMFGIPTEEVAEASA